MVAAQVLPITGMERAQSAETDERLLRGLIESFKLETLEYVSREKKPDAENPRISPYGTFTKMLKLHYPDGPIGLTVDLLDSSYGRTMQDVVYVSDIVNVACMAFGVSGKNSEYLKSLELIANKMSALRKSGNGHNGKIASIKHS